MDKAWNSINGFIVSFTTSGSVKDLILHGQKKKKKKRKSHPWKLSITLEMEYIAFLNSEVCVYRGGPVDRGINF